VSDLEWTRAVSKHQHHPPRPCDRPWTALCQSDHDMGDGNWAPRICWSTDHPTQPEAWAALEGHLREGACDPNRDQWWDLPQCKRQAEHEHRWVSNPTLGDRGGFAIQSCTGCTATREEPS